MSNEEILRYPIGRFTPKPVYSAEDIRDGIEVIRRLPSELHAAASRLTAQQLDTPYRNGGWTARQVIHHLADSHLNAYIRFKWTLTEETPIIKAYDEKLWAQTPETSLPPQMSVDLIGALHAKWTALLERLDNEAFNRRFVHPETANQIPLDRMLALYAWHGKHHLGHLRIVSQT